MSDRRSPRPAARKSDLSPDEAKPTPCDPADRTQAMFGKGQLRFARNKAMAICENSDARALASGLAGIRGSAKRPQEPEPLFIARARPQSSLRLRR